MQTLAKDFIGYKKSDSSSLSGSDERRLFSRKHSQEVKQKKKKPETIKSPEHDLRGRSQRFIQNLRKIAHHSTSETMETVCRFPENLAKKVVSPVFVRRTASETRATSARIVNGNAKLKGILKKSANESCRSQNDVQQNQSQFASCGSITSDGSIPSNIICNQLRVPSTLSLPEKQVKFNNKISTKKYKSSSPVVAITKLSRRQRRKLSKMHRRDSLESNPMEGVKGDDSIELKFEGIAVDTSSEDESSDDK